MRPVSRGAAGILAAWLAIAIVAGAAGWLRPLRPPAPQLVLAGLTLGLLALARMVPAARAWLRSIDTRCLVALHASRLVGVYFLVLHGRGELPFAFAVPGGVGDILVALGALSLVLAGPPVTARRRLAYRLWNAIGLLDILVVVATAVRLGMADPDAMRALLELPLSLLPTFLVPLIVATHVWLVARLQARPAPRGCPERRVEGSGPARWAAVSAEPRTSRTAPPPPRPPSRRGPA